MNSPSKPMTKDERRKAMPLTAEIVDAFTEEFGTLDAIRAEENGLSINWAKKPQGSRK